MTRSPRLLAVLAILMAVAMTGCKKRKPPEAAAKQEEPAAPPAPPVDPRNSAPVAGGGTIENVRKAARRAVTTNDLQQLGTLIFSFELENNKMPTIAEIKAFLKPDGVNLLTAIDEGAIILTGTTDKRGLWAYEVDADKAGGIIVTGPTPAAKRATAEEVKALLGK